MWFVWFNVYVSASCSIEEAKQKAEYDKKLLLAEQKKTSVRETIQTLREEFQKLIARNNALPAHLALSRKVSLPSLHVTIIHTSFINAFSIKLFILNLLK